jgi:hypothetical protein
MHLSKRLQRRQDKQRLRDEHASVAEALALGAHEGSHFVVDLLLGRAELHLDQVLRRHHRVHKQAPVSALTAAHLVPLGQIEKVLPFCEHLCLGVAAGPVSERARGPRAPHRIIKCGRMTWISPLQFERLRPCTPMSRTRHPPTQPCTHRARASSDQNLRVAVSARRREGADRGAPGSHQLGDLQELERAAKVGLQREVSQRERAGGTRGADVPSWRSWASR